ncbi:hypothetical protein ACQKP7_19140 [Pseudomonas frederiksbergensis]|uniref:hypothetical protein n=1 Tax=Pseudomonas frederiksbergensis TaxID=104087 RepID=UPI003CFEAEE4
MTMHLKLFEADNSDIFDDHSPFIEGKPLSLRLIQRNTQIGLSTVSEILRLSLAAATFFGPSLTVAARAFYEDLTEISELSPH